MISEFIQKHKLKRKLAKRKCYVRNRNGDDKCYGVCGGDSFTEYVSYGCIGCEYFSILISRRKEDI